jgi:hypothetical protein
MNIRALLVAAAATVLPAAVAADETWTSAAGDVIYAAEQEGVAIFTYPIADGDKGYLFFPGLAGNYDARGQHDGYWMAPGDGGCPAELTAINGMKSKNWGKLTIVFHSPGFPTGWTLMSGSCFGDLANSLVGMPKVAEATPAPAPDPAPEPPPSEPAPQTDTPPPPPPPPPPQ